MLRCRSFIIDIKIFQKAVLVELSNGLSQMKGTVQIIVIILLGFTRKQDEIESKSLKITRRIKVYPE
ncbi:MAG: hypothetical protein HeimC2_42710 [Candidatus Heimdallarchaeota archaeon LC_2]|nr:MAG: hypothetical protein HeimC2_42710 [Candidatus Heimdallarchaeota archaeon LC_2]